MARYSDLNLDFVPHPMTGDVTILTDMNALQRSVRNLVLTARYDRPFRPELDSGIHRYLFEPMTPLTAIRIKNAIEKIIKDAEPRVELVDVVVSANEPKNSFDVVIVFRPKNVRETGQVTLTLERAR
jgi:phage baseplate assembly protein W